MTPAQMIYKAAMPADKLESARSIMMQPRSMGVPTVVATAV